MEGSTCVSAHVTRSELTATALGKQERDRERQRETEKERDITTHMKQHNKIARISVFSIDAIYGAG